MIFFCVCVYIIYYLYCQVSIISNLDIEIVCKLFILILTCTIGDGVGVTVKFPYMST